MISYFNILDARVHWRCCCRENILQGESRIYSLIVTLIITSLIEFFFSFSLSLPLLRLYLNLNVNRYRRIIQREIPREE